MVVEPVGADTGGATVHAAGAEQGDLSEADAGSEGDENYTVIRTAHHLHRSTRNNEHLHPDIAFLLHKRTVKSSETYNLFLVSGCSEAH